MAAKLTEEEFANDVNNFKEKQGVEILIKYCEFNGVSRKYAFRCVVCSKTWKAQYGVVKSKKSGCKFCNYQKIGRSKRKTFEQFEEERIRCLQRERPVIFLFKYEDYTTMSGGKTYHFLCEKTNTKFFANYYNVVVQGTCCPTCAQNKIINAHRISEQQFNKEVLAAKKRKERPVNILTKFSKFKGVETFVECECPICLFKFSSVYVSVTYNKTGCSKCGRKTVSQKLKPTKQQWEKYCLEQLKNGKKVITKFCDYINNYNNKMKVFFECVVCGKTFAQSKNNSNKHGCPKCKSRKQGERLRHSSETFYLIVKEIERKTNSTLISDYVLYKGINTLLEWKCNFCNINFKRSINSMSKTIYSVKCPQCQPEKKKKVCMIQEKQYNKEVNKIKKDHSIIVLTKYKDFSGTKELVECLCEKCENIWYAAYGNVRFGHGCPKCCCVETKPEQKLFEFCKHSLNTNPEKRNKKKLSGLEIDIFCIQEKFGIEFHGNYWHSSTRKENFQTIHKTKYNRAHQAGIDLIQIFEDEYTSNPDLIHSIIRAKVDKPMHTYDAASCTPGSITEENLKAFMTANSFETYDEYDARVELADGSNPLAVLLWRKDEDAIRFKYVVARDTKVAGGLQRLLGTITPFYPNCALETASDARYSLHDKELEACGFIWSHITEPDRFYCVDNYKTRIAAVGENVDNLPEIYGVGFNIYKKA